MDGFRLPERDRRCFDQLPATIERVLTGSAPAGATPLDDPFLRDPADRVVLVYLDAFGWDFLERLEASPTLERARADGLVTQLTSQFPSTTTAHVATIHTGLPVAAHGLYEWHQLEPGLERLITPLLFCFAGDKRRDTLAGALDPGALYPRSGFYERLAAANVDPYTVHPAEIAGSTASGVLLESVRGLAYGSLAEAYGLAADALAAAERAYALVYLPHVDALMHELGPGDPAALSTFAAMIEALGETVFPPRTLVLLTSDHGMTPVDPVTTVYVNELWPELPELLATGADGKPLAPAGSCRDLFLHVRPGELSRVRDELAARLDGTAVVLTTDELVAAGAFDTPGERLRDRVGDLVVLPRVGEAVYWYEPGRFDQHLRGQHGGLSPAEMEIPLVAWRT
ncbi:MAG TPA: alkaline phosphatase family protein [Gaiellaceae bacterium]|nr:alkaline phosphatase family protein [Gaiellaceae bacterium]